MLSANPSPALPAALARSDVREPVHRAIPVEEEDARRSVHIQAQFRTIRIPHRREDGSVKIYILANRQGERRSCWSGYGGWRRSFIETGDRIYLHD
jgi:hypothetical protein